MSDLHFLRWHHTPLYIEKSLCSSIRALESTWLYSRARDVEEFCSNFIISIYYNPSKCFFVFLTAIGLLTMLAHWIYVHKNSLESIHSVCKIQTVSAAPGGIYKGKVITAHIVSLYGCFLFFSLQKTSSRRWWKYIWMSKP